MWPKSLCELTRVLMALVLILTLAGLLITEWHFYQGSIGADHYTELVMFLYGGGVLGKIIPLIIGVLADHWKKTP